jgi:hypothetical protein
LTTKEGKITNWPYSQKKPTQLELKALIKKHKDHTEYIEKRKAEYPAIEEQLDMIYRDKVQGTDKWRDLITNIKIKYPKPL